ncbi:MAG: hypothetical protein KF810_11610 [Rhizobiaceae bacterium]|nr:hypothetical protein [Rhizobiaceae bacterium]
MADQTVKIDGESGSKERVALDLLEIIYRTLPEERPKDKQGFIDLFVDCLAAANGARNGWR